MANLYLLGFMGTGKTSVGRLLSQRLSWKFLDLDDLIEEREGLKIAEIFSQKGEPYFRDLETKILKEVAQKSKLIVACGGGVVLKEENLSLIENSGIGICLEASPEVIYERTKKFTHRPLLNVVNPQGKIKELLEKRAKFYAKVKYHIDTSNLTVEEAVEKIEKLVKEKLRVFRNGQ
ncbi:MAG TPA: shikimate kinase [Candidatus Omnitrophica bacterium]|nr:MAG: shikimate kinase [Candidatus Omnitrophota bacterium]HEC69735.1 shikimate kinase [Candidatus Omnitrophota bacterium]